ncbi:DNA-methyltransferase [Moraxella cuniculi]|uniref:Methyltransferase n=1 Tax=Moraxella cuniculi TaxID=34061 RepID=A0A448GYG0_9GAMM|nr:site-specific DNA-methyltransferase [Moraxella cuniculi]VEG13718.1 Modification methylase RsrI [Moraxella cuniculi]
MNTVFFKDSRNMKEVPNNSVHLIITSPPYFNIKDYAKDGYQQNSHSNKHTSQIGDIDDYENYLIEMLQVWRECERVLTPNGKLVINTPLMPMLKKDMNTHYTRHIFDLNSDIQQTILKNTNLFLMDTYLWNRTNSSKKLMFGSYPYPRNFYAQNTTEFVTIYVKDGKPNKVSDEIKEKSKLTQQEWVEFTKQIWDIPIPNKNDLAFGVHSAIMPEEIPRRLIKLYSFYGDTVLDPFAGSGTTLKVAKELGRKYIGFELMEKYSEIIDLKLRDADLRLW